MEETPTRIWPNDLLRALTEYCAATPDLEDVTWQVWDSAWEQATWDVRRDALLMVGTELVRLRKELRALTDGA